MTMLKRIYLSIIRKPVKSLLLFALALVLGTFVGTSYLLGKSIYVLEDNMSQLDAYATISYRDLDRYEALNNSEIKEDQEKLMEKYKELSAMDYMIYDSIIYSSNPNKLMLDSNLKHGRIGSFVEIIKNPVHILGIDTLFFDLFEEQYEIVEGRGISEDDIENRSYVAVIDFGYRYPDGTPVKIGDQIEVIYKNIQIVSLGEYEIENEKSFTFEVIGKYKKNTNMQSILLESSFSRYSLLIPNDVFNEVKTDIENDELAMGLDYQYENFICASMIFKLQSPDALENFRNDYLRVFHDTDYYEAVTTADEYFYQIKGNLDNMLMISNTTMYIAAFASIFIGSLVVYLYLKDRKKEIGILLSMGEHKRNIMIQLICEIALLGLLGLSFSIGISNIIGNMITNDIVTTQAESFKQSDNEYIQEFINQFSIDMDSTYVIFMYGIGSITIVLSGILPIRHLLKFKPKEVLL